MGGPKEYSIDQKYKKCAGEKSASISEKLSCGCCLWVMTNSRRCYYRTKPSVSVTMIGSWNSTDQMVALY